MRVQKGVVEVLKASCRLRYSIGDIRNVWPKYENYPSKSTSTGRFISFKTLLLVNYGFI